ncbi:MAG: 4-(cytidine 5'-diphospho)-2-C-methyl-D-erythritol kinase [Ruthenibacterium lactatiformans]
MKKGISTAVLLSALLLLTLAAVFLLQCFLGGMLFDWNYREPLLFLACLFAGMVLLGIFRIIELLEQRLREVFFMRSVTVLAPAKLNLTLDVTGTRPDGYHTLDMIMQAVSLRERVTLRRNRGLSLSLPGSRVPANEHNTAYKAALAFFHGTGLLAGAAITVEKHVPVRAGMAGGSADAAAVLVGLNELYGARLSAAELCALGAQVGADVPFSIVGGTARYRCGRYPGAAEALPALLFTACMPAGGISTPQAYARYDRIGTDVRPDSAAAAAAIARGDLAGLCAQMKNALEYSSASAATKPICETLRAHGALAALMTGSGARCSACLQTRPRPRPRKRRCCGFTHSAGCCGRRRKVRASWGADED